MDQLVNIARQAALVVQRLSPSGVHVVTTESAPIDGGFDARVLTSDGQHVDVQVKRRGGRIVVTGIAARAVLAGPPPSSEPAPARSSRLLIDVAARILPAGARTRYAEEWRGELYDLRADGARWWRRAGHLAWVLLRAVPVLAITLRLSPRTAVD